MKWSWMLGSDLLLAPMFSQAEELMVAIGSDKPMAQGAGLILASQALERRATVVKTLSF